MAGEEYDVIIVGSGANGGWAAMQLCESGLKVLMLEPQHTPLDGLLLDQP